MSRQHTPGPWKVIVDEDGDILAITALDGDTYVIAGCGCCGPLFIEKDDAEANARLIAAAPDLLEALDALLPVAEAFEKQASRGTGGRRGGMVFTKARAAIAKAKGGNA